MIYWCDQGSPEWLKLRVGRVTASKVKEILGTKDAREKYMLELLAERLTGSATEHYVTKAMEHGMEFEPVARNAYGCDYGVEVQRPGFVTHDAIPWFGASPDGFIGEDGGLEIKCPETTTHIKWMEAGVIPTGKYGHLDQVLANLACNLSCSERAWWDFRSFDPRLPAELQSFDVRCHAKDHERAIKEMEHEVQAFLDELDARVQRLKGRKP